MKLIPLLLIFLGSHAQAAGVVNGQPVNAAVTNAAFLFKNGDDTDPFVLAFTNANPASGTAITNAQREWNAIESFLGMSPNQVFNTLPTWVTNYWGLSTNNIFNRTKALDTAFDPATGHSHNGIGGNGPLINLSTSTTGTLPIARGGTGSTNASDAFSALSPLTTLGDLLSYSSGNVRVAGNTSSSAKILVQTGTGAISALPAWLLPSGDITMDSAAVVTIAADAVTNSKLANMAQSTIKGRAVGAGTGDPTDLSATQATAILDNMVGDSGAGGTKGLVPAPGAGDFAAGKFLNAGGTFTAPSATLSTQSYEISNIGVSVTVAANALTFSLKQPDGSTDCTSGQPCRIGFRSSTATSGAFNQRNVTAALSVVISSGSTLGMTSAISGYMYMYALDNAGAVEIAVSQSKFDEGSLHSTTAEGGAGAADSNNVLYSTTARSNVPIRLLLRINISEATAGTWATAPTEVSLRPALDERWFVDSYITGADININTGANVTVYTPIESGALTLTNNPGNFGVPLTAKISCSSTNPSTGTTCAAGSEQIGIAFTPPTSGNVEVCNLTSWDIDIGSNISLGNAGVNFEIAQTTNTSQTILFRSERADITHQLLNANRRSIIHWPVRVCGLFAVTSGSIQTFRLLYVDVVSGTVNGIISNTTGGGTNPESHWTVRPILN